MSKNRPTIVLLVANDEVRLAAARLVRGTVEITGAATFVCNIKAGNQSPLRDQTLFDALNAHVKNHGWTNHDAVCLVSGAAVSCQHYDMPPLKGPALKQAATLKLGQQLHFDIGAAIVAADVAPSSAHETMIRVNATALHQAFAADAIETVAGLGLRLLTLSAAPSALAALAADMRKGMQGFQAVLHVDETVSTLVVLDGAQPFVTTELAFGAADFANALMRPIISGENVIQLDAAAAAALRDEIGIPAADQAVLSLQITGDRILPLIEPVLQKLAKQITQWLAFASTCNGGVPVKSLILVGSGAGISGFGPALAARVSIEVGSEGWLDGRTIGRGDADCLDSYAFAVAAIKHLAGLPVLIPDRIQRLRRVARIRTAVARCAPVVAAAVLAWAFVFNGISKDLQPGLIKQREQMGVVDQLLVENAKWARYSGKARALALQIDDFTRSTPSWQGVFKEMSLLLPSELKAVEFVGKPGDNGTKLIVRAAVHCDHTKRSFDEIVSQTVVVLQRSALFRRVELSANRGPQNDDPKAAGMVSIQLDLAHPMSRIKA